jgi:hypothetical protein
MVGVAVAGSGVMAVLTTSGVGVEVGGMKGARATGIRVGTAVSNEQPIRKRVSRRRGARSEGRGMRSEGRGGLGMTFYVLLFN